MGTFTFILSHRFFLFLGNCQWVTLVTPTQVFGHFDQQKFIRGQMRDSGTALLGLMLQHQEQKQVTGALACWFGGGGGVRSWFLKWDEGGADEWVDQRGGLGSLPTPLVVLCAGSMPSTMLLLPAPQKGQVVCDLFVSYCA